MAWEKLKSLFKAAKPDLTDTEIDDAIAEIGQTGGQPPTPPQPAPQPPTPPAPQPAAGQSPELSQVLAENQQLRDEVSKVLKALGEMKARDDAAQKAMADRAKDERAKTLKAKADEYIKAGKFPEAKRAELEADLIADAEGRLQKHYDAMPANPAVNRQAPAPTNSTPSAGGRSADANADRAQRTSAALAEIAASMPTN